MGRAAVTGGDGPQRRRHLARARAATMIALFVLALVFASWAPRVPQIKTDLRLGDGRLGLALLGAPVGAVLTLWLVGIAVTRFGSVRVVRAALPCYCAVGSLFPFVDGQWSLFALLALWGATSSGLDIAANAQAVGVEHGYGRPIMATAHAAWTAGALVGAGIGTAAAALAVPVSAQFAALGAIGLVIALPATWWMLPDPAGSMVEPSGWQPRAEPSGGWSGAELVAERSVAAAAEPARERRRRRLPRPFVALCAVAFGSFLCEGVAADWSAVYLSEVTGAAAGVAGAGFVAFTVCMFAVRLVGDRVMARYGPARTVRGFTAVAGVGFAGALAVGALPFGSAAGVIGFGALGVGTACVVPAVFSTAGRLGGSAGTSIAVVSTVGYAGWLAGPPVVGGLAELVGLHRALTVVLLLLTTIAAFAPALRAPSADPAADVQAPIRAGG
ncbi:MFS transporter [Frankia sp. QA3]|uniref:MFS transporter n=1 Tax=Frankia sp. QA3 TaxID=710111 RepID=UPI000269C42C|nr:MFS transporter [Frankia sp. QA3]EIV94316.1 sugar phosphate permease [Frankia sp. QA3]